MKAAFRWRQHPISCSGAAPSIRLRSRCTSQPADLAAATEPQSPEALLEVARQFYEEVWSNGRINRLNTLMHPDHKQVDAIWQHAPGIGRERMKRGILAYRAAYPDLRFHVEHIAACSGGSSSVMVHWSATGTNLGPIREQAPTLRPVSFSGITLLAFDEQGRIAESRVYRQAPEDERAYFTGAAK